MRLWAAAAVLLCVSSCGTPIGDPGLPEFRLEWASASGETVSSESGEVGFALVSRTCWTNDAIRIVNVGRATGRFRLSEPSEQFSYEQGPFELRPAEFVVVPIRLYAKGNENSAQHELRIEPENLAPLTFALKFGFAEASLHLPRFDFKAVVVGQEAANVAPGVGDLTGDFRKESSEMRFRPSSVGAQLVRADYTYQRNCEPGTVFIRGDGVASLVHRTTPSIFAFSDTPAGTTTERPLSLDLWTDEAPMIFATETASTTSAPSTIFTIEPIEVLTTSVTRGGDNVLIPAHREYRVRFTPTSAGPVQHYVHGAVGGEQFALVLRGSGT